MPQVYLYDIINSIEKIEKYINGYYKDDFLSQEDLQDKIIRRLQVIGEAARRVPESLQDDHPEIPWLNIKGIRNVIIHDYSDIDFGLIWKVIQEDLPELKDTITKIIEKL